MTFLMHLVEKAMPLLNAVDVLTLLVIAGYSLYVIAQRFSAGLALVFFASVLSAGRGTVWVLLSMNNYWQIHLFPLTVRQVLYIGAELVYPLEIVLWTTALLLLIRSRRPSPAVEATPSPLPPSRTPAAELLPTPSTPQPPAEPPPLPATEQSMPGGEVVPETAEAAPADGGKTAPVLYIFSGLPGTGKSALASRLAERLGAVYLRIDTVEQALRDLFTCDVQGEGYRLSHRLADDNLRLGLSVVADSCNPLESTRDEWENIAREAGAGYLHIEILCSDEAEHRQRVETRAPQVPGLVLPTWQAVGEREYHLWTRERLIIDTAGKSPEESLTDLLALLPAATCGLLVESVPEEAGDI